MQLSRFYSSETFLFTKRPGRYVLLVASPFQWIDLSCFLFPWWYSLWRVPLLSWCLSFISPTCMDPKPHAVSMSKKWKLPVHLGVAFWILHITHDCRCCDWQKGIVPFPSWPDCQFTVHLYNNFSYTELSWLHWKLCAGRRDCEVQKVMRKWHSIFWDRRTV